MNETRSFWDFADRLLSSPEPGAVTDYKSARIMEATTPNISNAWTHVVPTLAKYAKCEGKRSLFGCDKGEMAFRELEEKLHLVVLGLYGDRLLSKGASTEECLSALLRSLILFKEVFPNWTDAYSAAYRVFVEGRENINPVLARHQRAVEAMTTPIVCESELLVLCQKLSQELSIQREEFFAGSLSGLRREEVVTAHCPSTFEAGSNIDSALKGYQLTCIVGFMYDYIKLDDYILFDKILTKHLNVGDALRINNYRDRYLDCKGHIDLLASCLAQDIYELMGKPNPAEKVTRLLSVNAVTFAIMGQAAAARLCGDYETERELKSKLHVL